MNFTGISVRAALIALGLSQQAAAMTEHQQQVAAWRAARVERLTAPDGWLSLVGLHWLPAGASQTLGNGPDNEIDLGRGPKRLGTLSWDADKASFAAAADAGIVVDGAAVERTDLLPDSSGKPTIVEFGSARFQLIQRGDKYALRVKDSEAATRTGFKGIRYYDIDSSWRVDARFEAYEQARTIEVATVVGTIEAYPNPGRIVFERDGKTLSLEALVEEGTDQFFFIMADRTSGKETYGMARYLYAGPPVDGKIVVDFNQAYNPPCAFTPYATCPMPPEGNRLDAFVRAGELKYDAAGH